MTLLGGPVKAWVRTKVGRTVVDRMAIPAISTVLLGAKVCAELCLW
jgi:hypothetical protein